MMVEPDNIVLEHLRAIRGDVGKLLGEMQTMRAEMTAMRQFMAGMMTIQEHDHVDIAGIKSRLDRIEKTIGIGGLSNHHLSRLAQRARAPQDDGPRTKTEERNATT